jgi:hypothetical protein
LRQGPTSELATSPDPDEEFIAARLTRQQRLTNDPLLALRVVIYEAVLRNFPGGEATARGQLDHLTRLTELPNLTIQIFPLGAGTHPGLNGSFNVISFAAAGAMDVVYVEAPFAQRWVEGGEAAATYDELFEKRSRNAPSASGSRSRSSTSCARNCEPCLNSSTSSPATATRRPSVSR